VCPWLFREALPGAIPPTLGLVDIEAAPRVGLRAFRSWHPDRLVRPGQQQNTGAESARCLNCSVRGKKTGGSDAEPSQENRLYRALL